LGGPQAVVQPFQHGDALRHLVQRYVFVGLVRLLDRARAAHDRRAAKRLEKPGLGPEGHSGRAVLAGQVGDDLSRLVVGHRFQPRDVAHGQSFNFRAFVDGSHRGE